MADYAFIDAAARNDVALVKELIGEGVDVNGFTAFGYTALHWAVERGFVECAKLLLEANADTNKADSYGWTPFHSVSRRGHAECKGVVLLIDWKANVNAIAKNGHSPLHYAAFHGHLACVEMLIQAGAEVDARDKNGFTPLAQAILNNKLDVAQLLPCKGAKVINISKRVKIPPQALIVFSGRENAKRGLLTFMAVLRKRYTVSGAGTEHIRGKLPLDVVRLLGRWVWSTRFDERWRGAIPESTSRCHLQ